MAKKTAKPSTAAAKRLRKATMGGSRVAPATPAAPKHYVLQTIWYEPDKRHAFPGERVDMTYAGEQRTAALVAAKVLMPEETGKVALAKQVAEQPAPQPVENLIAPVPATPETDPGDAPEGKE